MRPSIALAALAFTIAASGALAGCAGAPPVPGPVVSNYVYHLGPRDKIKVTVLGDANNSGEYSVDGEGIVSLPLAGNIQAKGMTLTEFRATVENRLKNYMRNPHVAAEVDNFRPVYILGDVTNPGEFPYAENMTVFALAAKAGGFTYRAATHYVFIRHDGESNETKYKLTSGTAIQPGDTVRVAQRIF